MARRSSRRPTSSSTPRCRASTRRSPRSPRPWRAWTRRSRRNDADIGIQLQKTVEDLAALRGQVETYLYKIGELEAALASSRHDAEKKQTALQSADAQKEAEAKKKAEALKRPEDKKDFLALAEEKAKAGEWPWRASSTRSSSRSGPRIADGEAHFGLGETYYTESKCREALYEYGKVIQDFAKTPSAPEAYLRSSDCFRKLKMIEESRLALEELVKDYPKSDAAKTAKVKLAELDKAKKPAPPPRQEGQQEATVAGRPRAAAGAIRGWRGAQAAHPALHGRQRGRNRPLWLNPQPVWRSGQTKDDDRPGAADAGCRARPGCGQRALQVRQQWSGGEREGSRGADPQADGRAGHLGHGRGRAGPDARAGLPQGRREGLEDEAAVREPRGQGRASRCSRPPR